MKPAKVFFQQRMIAYLRERTANGQLFRVLELGCGRAEVTAGLLQAVPGLEYIGIEPDPQSSTSARKNLAFYPGATVLDGLAYGKVPHPALQQPFDLVFSLSVLEHVKDLPSFLKYAASMAKSEARIVHLYDLGHALSPSSWKEWMQTRLCATPLLRFVPETKVARYLATEEVQRLIEREGCEIEEVSFHNMPSHVKFLKVLDEPLPLVEEVNACEQRWSTEGIPLKKKERLFHTIGFWTKKI